MNSLGIVTATYNRAYIIDKLYQSIINQETNLKVIWYVFDDGSSDNTKQLINSFIAENKVQIEYYYNDNSGKMAAINNNIHHVITDYMVEIDSDDFLLPDALKIMEEDLKYFDNNIIAVVGNRVDNNNNVIGKSVAKYCVSTLTEEFYKGNMSGDKTIIFNTKLRKKYEYKLEENERFATEARTYLKMASDGMKMAIVSSSYVVCEYQTDGYSLNIINFYKQNPYTHYYYYIELLNYLKNTVNFKTRLHVIKQILLFHFILNNKISSVAKSIDNLDNKLFLYILYFPGKYIYNRKYKN